MENVSKTKWLFVSVLAIAMSLMLVERAHSQSPMRTFPAGKPITIIVPWPPGGSSDVTARLVAAGLEKELSTPVQVVNKPGASSQAGMTALISSKPDGYTLALANLPVLLTHYLDPSREAPYSLKHFQPVAHQWQSPVAIAVGAGSPYKTLKDLVGAAKANPGKITMSDPGLMSNPHLGVLLLEKATGVEFASVHFPGGAPAVTALLGGHVNAGAPGIAEAMTHVKSGAFRALAVTSEKECEFLPGVPTMRSLGYDFVFVSSGGYVAPAGTPKDVVEILSEAIKKIVESDEHKKSLSKFATSSYYLNAEQYYAFWKEAETQFGGILKAIRASERK